MSFDTNNYINKKYNRLTIKYTYKKNNRTYVHCVCECGNYKDIRLSRLKSGETKSCGCLRKDISRGKGKKKPYSNTKLFYTYHGIKTRCYNTKSTSYKYYGAKGIKMCDEWLNDFKTFQEWAYNNGYQENKGLSIDRIDVNGNYEPKNCRWVDNTTQANNRTDNYYITYKGQTLTASEWSKKLGIHNQTIKSRINRGWSVEKALTTPVKNNNQS